MAGVMGKLKLHLEDVPEALDQDDLQHDLQQLLRHFCKEDSKQEAQ